MFKRMKETLRLAILCILVLISALFLFPPELPADEGMWPLSELPRLNLQEKGLRLDPALIYDPARQSLLYAVVEVGATGSFISPDGLIITNHHVAFGSVVAASTPEKDYLKSGFLARTRAEEIPATGRTARITESFRDVSAEVLGAVKRNMSYADRTRAIEQQIKKIIARAEKENPGKRAEVAEMFPGKTYWLFLYTVLRDIRLVYVPPLAIGNFGGEDDNWMWPRHTGDFAVARLVPLSERRGGRIGGYLVGTWPFERGSPPQPIYRPPSGFIEVTPMNVNLRVSEHFRLGDFLTKGQGHVWPKYVVVSPRLLDKLELTLQELERSGHPVRHVFVVSGFRTPYYNEHGGDPSGRGALSRHMYGDAADIAVDNDRNGCMDDLNGDGRVDVRDARLLAQAAERVEERFPSLVGGIGVYAPTGAHCGFVHIDTRGYRARWGAW